MIDPHPILYCGRNFSSEDLALMRQAARDCAGLGVTEIARTICEWLDWKRPNGQLKNHECRLLLERLQHDGFLTLPPLRPSGRRGPRPVSTDLNTPPTVHVKGLASTLLARSARQLPHDWRQHYGYTPLLLETLVDAERFRGTCYRAANWIHLGQTTGGSRTDRLRQLNTKTAKLLFVF